ncbi:MAG: 2-amino-4-hydroxy-6-hydroxymethyldihydropteridine diphosphokinase [Aestuariivirga sp.]|uniref:2-amino-4-hydroxy-6- hydroxymethyldihydropteridine diphosphokinase n=1 Tax=Aestuariivirga sp. TaxID=2650926 RepID=UPI0038CFE7DA
MILIGLGANRSGPWGSPRQTVLRALRELNTGGIRLKRASGLLVSAPFGRTDQPDFVNAVAEVETRLSPRVLLARLHAIERKAGRRRGLRWGPRTLDLDLLDYHGLIRRHGHRPRLPHPGISSRIFVLAPLAGIAPGWRHPVSRQTAATLLRRLDQAGEGRLL